MIAVPIRRLHEAAVVPERAYEGDAGLDLSACETVELAPGQRAVVGTGLAVAIPEGYAGFRGEIRVVLLNTDREVSFLVQPGMRIAQLVVVAVPAVEVVETDDLPESERGVRGFGSSRAR